ncbi:hypothetical protein VTK73DRAFT_6896 [Phialemonium thermophilum]|uniref:Uncharacterized protein n=1 Tax=Phialemonium thermophilum TaxID=223376 RepID=A0ABR3WHK1_9PEZI
MAASSQPEAIPTLAQLMDKYLLPDIDGTKVEEYFKAGVTVGARILPPSPSASFPFSLLPFPTFFLCPLPSLCLFPTSPAFPPFTLLFTSFLRSISFPPYALLSLPFPTPPSLQLPPSFSTSILLPNSTIRFFCLLSAKVSTYVLFFTSSRLFNLLNLPPLQVSSPCSIFFLDFQALRAINRDDFARCQSR